MHWVEPRLVGEVAFTPAHPDGIDGERVSQKNVSDYPPDWVKRVREQRKDKRGDRLFLDVMRNAYEQTVVVPFSVRARPGLTWRRRCTGGRSRTRSLPRAGSRCPRSSSA